MKNLAKCCAMYTKKSKKRKQSRNNGDCIRLNHFVNNINRSPERFMNYSGYMPEEAETYIYNLMTTDSRAVMTC